ncbi:MAG: AbrB family transcriptional regulator [Dehalobacterium sp.]
MKNNKLDLRKLENITKTFLVALAGGAVGHLTNMPGGIILGSMASVGLLNIISPDSVSLPKYFSFYLQIFAGILLGVNLNITEIALLGDLILPSLFIALILLLSGLGAAFTTHKLFDWDLITAWLSCSPGRMQDMVIFAHDLNADSTKVVIVHTTRIILVVIITPLILLMANNF